MVAMLAAIMAAGVLPGAAQAAFPGTNGKLAFSSARNGFPADNDLYAMNADGSAQTRITSLNLDEFNPAWSATGHKVAFERYAGLRSDIWVANANGTSATPLTTHPANDIQPAWNPSGTKIVFASDRASAPGWYDLFVMDSNGANQVNLTNTLSISEEYPAWSPDGTALAFTRNGDLYKSTPSLTNLTPLAANPATMEIEPDWSPSSNKIVYRNGVTGIDDVWTVNASGGGHANITNNGSIVDEKPTWSPDGTKIAFIRGSFNNAEVYTVNPNGTGALRITNNNVMDAGPAWQVAPSTPPPPDPPPPPPPSTDSGPSTPPPAPPTGGQPAGAAGTSVPRVPQATLQARKVKLARLIRRGIRLSMTCPAQCSFDVRLLRSTAVVGRFSGGMSAPATKPVTVKLSKRAKRTLRRRPPPKLTVSVVVRGADGGVLLKHRRSIRVQSD